MKRKECTYFFDNKNEKILRLGIYRKFWRNIKGSEIWWLGKSGCQKQTYVKNPIIIALSVSPYQIEKLRILSPGKYFTKNECN